MVTDSFESCEVRDNFINWWIIGLRNYGFQQLFILFWDMFIHDAFSKFVVIKTIVE